MLGELFQASVVAALIAALVAAVASICFLRTRHFFHDSVALAVTEAGLLLLAAGIVAGTVGRHTGDGRWWNWDADLTAALAGFLLYAPYLMLRNAIEEPSRRAATAAVLSIFACGDLPAIVMVVRWWRQPTAVQVFEPALWWYIVVPLGAAFTLVRFRQEQRRRAADAERRTAQEL